MKYSILALLLCGCSVVQSGDTPTARIVHIEQDRLNIPDGAKGKCLAFVEAVTPKLRSAGATNLRWLTMSVAGEHAGHIIMGYTADGRDWLADDTHLRPAVGDDSQDKILRFMNPWQDSMCNVTLISDTAIK